MERSRIEPLSVICARFAMYKELNIDSLPSSITKFVRDVSFSGVKVFSEWCQGWGFAFLQNHGRDIVLCGQSTLNEEGKNFVRSFSVGRQGLTKLEDGLLDKETHTNGVFALTVLNNVVLSGSDDNCIGVWDWRDGKQGEWKGKLRLHSANVNAVTSGDGCVFSGGDDAIIGVWKPGEDVTSFSLVKQLQFHKDWVRALAFSPLGLVSGSDDNVALLWDVEVGSHRVLMSNGGQYIRAVACGVWKNGPIALIGIDSGRKLVFDLRMQESVAELEPAVSSVRACCIAPYPWKESCFFGRTDGKIEEWDARKLDNHIRLLEHNGVEPVRALGIGHGCLWSGGGDSVQMWR